MAQGTTRWRRFSRILKRNEDYSEVIESDYDTVEYRKKFERFKRITSSHS